MEADVLEKEIRTIQTWQKNEKRRFQVGRHDEFKSVFNISYCVLLLYLSICTWETEIDSERKFYKQSTSLHSNINVKNVNVEK